MRTFSRWAGGLALAATLASAASPAMADRGWNGGRGWDRGYRHHDRGDGFGTFVGVAALLGAVAVIASSAAKDRQVQRDYPQRDYPRQPDSGPYGDSHYDGATAQPAPSQSASTEDAAIDDCAVAAREEASRDGAYAEMRDVGDVRPVDGGYEIDGTVDQRNGYRGTGITRRFSCSWRDGRVSDMILSRDSIALR